MITDIYSLLQHLRDEELKAHNTIGCCMQGRACDFDTEYCSCGNCVIAGREKFARELIDRIENSPNQRPHIQVGGKEVL